MTTDGMDGMEQTLRQLWQQAIASDGGRVRRYEDAALGVATTEHQRFCGSRYGRAGWSHPHGRRVVGLVRVEWRGIAGHDDDELSVTGTYLPAREGSRVIVREVALLADQDGAPDWTWALRADGPLAGHLRRARLVGSRA